MVFLANVEFRKNDYNPPVNIQFRVTDGKDDNNTQTICKPLNILSNLITANKFDMIYEDMTKETPFGEVHGNCHEVVSTIMAVLIRYDLCKGWEWCKGYKKDGMGKGVDWIHSWLEFDGWAIDASNTHRNIPVEKPGDQIILIYGSSFYRNLYGLKVRKRKNAKNTKKWLFKEHNKG